MQKTIIFPYALSFFTYFNTLGIRPAPGNHESNFRKVGSIPCGFKTMENIEYISDAHVWFDLFT